MLGTTVILASCIFLTFLSRSEGGQSQSARLIEKFASKDFDNGEFRFASYYQDHMVLQRAPGSAIIWGYGSRSGIITAVVDDDVYSTSVHTGPENAGTWSITLKPHIEGGPFKISVTQEVNGNAQVITLKDVCYGEVWVCSGQSNMVFGVIKIINATFEMEDSVNYPFVRVMQVGKVTSPIPLSDLKSISTPWSVPTARTVGHFSAVCWLYGKYLYKKLKIPFGLIDSAWGGTTIEDWSSTRALKRCNLNKVERQAKLIFKPPRPPRGNSPLWNAMIHPLVKMTIKGAIWYQGEANAHYHRDSYNCSFPSMIDDWRKSWYDGTYGNTDPQFPFGFVQLCIKNAPDWFDDGDFSDIRWHQTADYGFVPNARMPKTFMAVTMDLFDKGIAPNSVHPRDKEDVARRLSLGARRYVYGEDIVSDGPFPQSIGSSGKYNLEVKYKQDQIIVVHEAVQNFQICCSPAQCAKEEPFNGTTWTNATIKQWNDHSVFIPTQLCPQGANAVRYAWTISPCPLKKCQVYNKHGLPAAPFYFKVPFNQMK